MRHKYFFHYTNARKLSSIFDKASEDKGLQPNSRFIRLGHARGLPDKAHEEVIWGMLSPRPAEIINSNWGRERGLLRGFLQRARGHLEPTYLLRAHVVPSDDIYVADFGPHLSKAFRGTSMNNRSIVHQTKKAYWETLVPLQEYDEGMNYQVPEVICFNAIPCERLEIFDAIPCSEMDRYIATGEYDPSGFEIDRAGWLIASK
jgi:hypothetical protein